MSESNNDELRAQLLHLHRLYNEVGELQQQIPSKRPRYNNNHVQKEQAICEKARQVLVAANAIYCHERKDKAEVENIKDGCRQIMADPYKKLGGIVSLS